MTAAQCFQDEFCSDFIVKQEYFAPTAGKGQHELKEMLLLLHNSSLCNLFIYVGCLRVVQFVTFFLGLLD